MDIYNIVNAFVLDQVSVSDLPTLATDMIQSGGSDSTALYDLADSRGMDAEYIRNVFLKALVELGVALPSRETAALSYAKKLAKEVVDGTLAPYDGARRIWGEIYTYFPGLHQLRVFVGLASEYEDDESHRDEYGQMILDECKSLLQQP